MPFTNDLPEWNKGDDAKPAQSKLDAGWTAEEKPPASIFNWFFNRAYLAIKNLRDNAIHKEEKGQPNGVASLDGSGKVPTAQLPTQNGFTTFKVGATNVTADSGADTLELVAGTNITLTPDATNDKITISASGGTAAATSITDTGNYYTSNNAEGALQEVGQTLNAVRGSLVTSAQSLL